jgi:CheY-like chemotaxis protein
VTAPRLLLVDDSPEVAVLARALARRAGHAVTVAPGVGAARAALAREGFDLVLLDVNLAGESGLELLRSPAARPPVALFCQPDLTEDVAAGWALGADFLVSKALLGDPPGWQARVAEVLAWGRGRPGLAGVEWGLTAEQAPSRPISPSRAAALVRAMRHPIFRSLGAALVDEIARRALNQTTKVGPARLAGPLRDGRLQELLSEPTFTELDLRRLCAAVTDQLGRLCGDEARRAAETVLAEEVLLGLVG